MNTWIYYLITFLLVIIVDIVTTSVRSLGETLFSLRLVYPLRYVRQVQGARLPVIFITERQFEVSASDHFTNANTLELFYHIRLWEID